MPTVPVKDNISVAPTLSPAPAFQNTQTLGEAQIPGQQLEDYGKAETNLGAHEASIALDIQDEANTLRVDDAMNQAKEMAMRLQYDQKDGYHKSDRLTTRSTARTGNRSPTSSATSSPSTPPRSRPRSATTRSAAPSLSRVNDLIAVFQRSRPCSMKGNNFRPYAQSVRETARSKTAFQNIALNYDKPDIIAEKHNVDTGERERPRASAREVRQPYGEADWRASRRARRISS
jgi:soluble lytic murein transglycosylase